MNITTLPNKFPLIDLGDIVLRELSVDDAEYYLAYMSREEMKPFLLDNNRPTNIEHAISEIRYWSGIFQNHRGFYWAIADKKDNRLLGTAGFNNIIYHHKRGEISYDLDPEFWGKGIMLRSIKAILKFSDLALGLVRIQAMVIDDNIRSIKLLERCNFEQEGLMKKYEIVNGKHCDYYIHARVVQ